MDFRPLIRESLKMITFIGLNPFCTTLIYSMIQKFVVFITICTLIDIWSILGLTYRGIASTKEVLITAATSQIAMKMLFFFINKVDLKVLINNTNMFWKRNFLYSEQEEENERIFSFVKWCMRLYTVVLLTICSLQFLNPLFHSENTELPWISNCSRFFSFKICYVMETIMLIIVTQILLGFDLFYISLITNIICELKLLKRHFQNLRINPIVHGTDKEAMDDLKQLIDHHNLILICIRIMKHVYSLPLLGVFLCNMFGMCFSLIIVSSNVIDKSVKVLSGIRVIYYMIQLSFYCAFGTILSDESVTITNAVYNSQWWIKTQPELRKSLVMVMRRANRPEILTAGGFFPINLQTFTMILKHTFSFFTFMQVMYDD